MGPQDCGDFVNSDYLNSVLAVIWELLSSAIFKVE